MAKASGILTPEQQALQTAIEGLYTAFAGYPLREVIPGCVDCLEQTNIDHLHTVPLRLLTEEDLAPFLVNNAGRTVGDALDLKHFLPRLFELVSQQEASSSFLLPPETLGLAVSEYDYGTWPQPEQQALQFFCLAWWQMVLATMPRLSAIRDERVDTLLCTISQFTKDLEPYLEAWRHTRSRTALAQLVVFIRHYLMDANAERRRNPWWGGQEHQWEQIVAWVLDPATARWIREMWDRTNAAKQQEADLAASRLPNRVLDWLASQIPNEK
ncbi:MAG TPA: hypothetical protein VKR06_04210 [Ktedonosporobacter sp.]|nr:hypothetical protein [Ktedonosporobacter sp.]